MWFISVLSMMVSIESFYRQHIRRCDWETFEGCKEFLDQVQIKGDKLGKRMMYERKQHICEKRLKVQPSWILGTIKRELNLFEHDGTLDNLHDEHDKAFESRHELWA
jgi:predicted NUDIX family phosphoesterase